MLKEKAIVDTLINYSLFTNGVILVFSMWYTKFRFLEGILTEKGKWL